VTTVLTRDEVRSQVARFVRGELRRDYLAAWAFDQVYAEEEGRVEFEPGYAVAIDAVLDELMFGDSPPFVLDEAQAQRLIQALDQARPTEAAADE
jgi:hypothetical protein